MQLSSTKWYILAVFGVFLWSFNVIVSRYLTGILLPWQHRQFLKQHLKWLVVLSAVGISFSNTFVYYDIVWTRLSLQEVETAYQKMDSVANLMWDKYQKGLIEYSDVLDAQQRRLAVQTQMVDSNSALYQNIVTFYKAIGGTFTPVTSTAQKS